LGHNFHAITPLSVEPVMDIGQHGDMIAGCSAANISRLSISTPGLIFTLLCPVKISNPLIALMCERSHLHIPVTRARSERLYRRMADILVAGGFRDAGYDIVAVDDCWMSLERGPDNRLQADPSRFPNGIKNLSDYVGRYGFHVILIYTFIDVWHRFDVFDERKCVKAHASPN
jgi:hypothetical protein